MYSSLQTQVMSLDSQLATRSSPPQTLSCKLYEPYEADFQSGINVTSDRHFVATLATRGCRGEILG